MALGKLVKLAHAFADLSEQDSQFVREYVSLIKSTPVRSGVKAPKKPKRKYTRRAPAAAIEVAPGVKVMRKKRVSSEEVDHSPRSVAEQVR